MCFSREFNEILKSTPELHHSATNSACTHALKKVESQRPSTSPRSGWNRLGVVNTIKPHTGIPGRRFQHVWSQNVLRWYAGNLPYRIVPILSPEKSVLRMDILHKCMQACYSLTVQDNDLSMLLSTKPANFHNVGHSSSMIWMRNPYRKPRSSFCTSKLGFKTPNHVPIQWAYGYTSIFLGRSGKDIFWLVVLTCFKPSWKILVNGKDYPIYYGKWNMFQTTNQYFVPLGPSFQINGTQKTMDVLDCVSKSLPALQIF